MKCLPSFLIGAVVGAIMGAIVALLLAPLRGEELRSRFGQEAEWQLAEIAADEEVAAAVQAEVEVEEATEE